MAAGTSPTVCRTRAATLFGQLKSSRIVGDEAAVLRGMCGDRTPLGRQVRRSPPAASHAPRFLDLRIRRERPSPDGIRNLPDPRDARLPRSDKRGRLVIAMRIVTPRSQHGRATGGAHQTTRRRTIASKAGRRVAPWYPVRAERSAGPAAGRGSAPPPLPRLRAAPPALAVDRVWSPGCDRLPSVRITTRGGRAAAQHAAISPPQPRLSSSGCGARIRQAPAPITSSSDPIGRARQRSCSSPAVITRTSDAWVAREIGRRLGQHIVRCGLPKIRAEIAANPLDRIAAPERRQAQ